jgi:hypothetical protein
LAELKMYEKALSEFEAADKILPNNEGIKSNINSLSMIQKIQKVIRIYLK